jgi:glucokinase
MQKLRIPVAFKHWGVRPEKPVTVLAGDVGGTKTNLALFSFDGEKMTDLREARYASKQYNSLADIIRQFAANEWPDRICIAVAGPVLNGNVKLTNLSWDLNSKDMTNKLSTPVYFLNDLEATGYGLAASQSNQLAPIHSGDITEEGNIAIIAAGTGLGEAGLFFDGENYHPFATEGGHSDFAPRTEQDLEMWRFLQKKFGHVSWERVVSGPGIYTIFQFLKEVEGRKVPDWLNTQIEEQDPSASISIAAIHQQEPICVETMELFSRYMATEAASLVLKLKATGGCYLAGGISPKTLPILQDGKWYKHFLDAGRMQPLLQQVPVYVMLNQKAPLVGAAYYGMYNM